jgi:hypothetical protein
MTALTQILEDREINANQLAKMMEKVKAPNVYKWAKGEQPIPAYRVDEIAELLDLSVQERDDLGLLVSDRGHGSRSGSDDDKIVTYMGYAFEAAYRGDRSEAYGNSMQRFADAAGISALTLGRYLSGERLIPLDEVDAIADALSPAQPAWAVGGLVWQVADGKSPGRFGRLRTDISNADTLADIKALVADYERPDAATPMDPDAALAALRIKKSETHATANKIAEGYFLDASYGRIE